MALHDRFTVLSKASFRPNKVVFYNQFFSNVVQLDQVAPVAVPVLASPSVVQLDAFAPPLREKFSNLVTPDKTENLPLKQVTACNQHNFELSKKAAGRIKEKVSWLYELARHKTVVRESGEPILSFKMNFITLTLPSLQAHTTSEITSLCLNQFLTELKEKFNLQNYVWRLEFQKNGNAHYHIATDTFVEYGVAKLIWNRCLRKLGYIAAYREKFSTMSLAEYCRLYSQNGKIPFDTLKTRYFNGRATNWDSPNTVDVRAVGNARNIAFYISKYITKKSDHTLNPVVSSREPETTNLRLWYCSRSLSALDKIEIFMDAFDDLVGACLNGLSNVRRYIFDYCSVWYFSAVEQSNAVKASLWALYRRYASERGYIPAQ